MSFSFSPGGRGHADPWFRVGTVDVSTTVLVTAAVVVSMVAYAVTGGLVAAGLWMTPEQVFGAQVWRVVTWPLANDVSIWTVLNAFFLWYFGTELESEIGRRRMAWMLLGFTLALSAVALLLSLVTSGVLTGIGTLELMVLLAWIAENPTRRFLFNIPAWAFGAVIVGIQVLGLVAAREAFGLLSLLIGLAVCAMVARSVGLLTQYAWLPALPGTGGRRSGSGSGGAPRPRRPRRTRRGGRKGEVVSGPWSGSSHHGSSPRARDRARLDELLDKISERGMDSLSGKEKKELMELRDRLSRG